MAVPTKAIGLGVLVLLVVFSVPMMIEATEGDKKYRVEMSENDTTNISDRLNVTADNIQPGDPANATISVEDTRTFESDTKTIEENASATYSFDGGDVTVNVTAIETNPEVVRGDVKVDRTYGWSGPGKVIAGELGLILAMLGVIIVAGAIGAMIP